MILYIDILLFQCRSISSKEISVLILSGNFLAIALVDQYKLSHSWLEDVCASDFCNDTPDYTGHYIVICGYDADADEFEIRDPASSRKYGRVTSKCLEKARKSFGTDEDLLLIRVEREEAKSSNHDRGNSSMNFRIVKRILIVRIFKKARALLDRCMETERLRASSS
ncbi:Complement component 1 Q subcomponent-binding protein, mitochondrial [Datura stramonium]|uniref:Complement component 1 Q subcomponent-binding protein, mitochondrial n=1 Tax=Datura stramonium TaxID=4076 RepID=A0ABS8UUI2_DATST|nr:Complement component 1 Q subcomponent-binding protein, mitochondrial [Datura stramonium]